MITHFACPRSVGAIIDGCTTAPADAGTLEVRYPGNGEVVSTLVESGADEVDRAARAARASFAQGPWRRKSVEQRGEILGRISDIILENAEELAWLECMNAGLPMARIRHTQIARAAWNFRFFAEVASQSVGQAINQDPRYLTTVLREPVGVAALISPWNAPVALSSMKVAAAIAFGNSCVLKPSELTPLAVHRLVELIHEAGVPEGVVNLVNGRGHVTGSALVAHEDVDLVSFTGGTQTGRLIAAEAGRRLIPTTMELGGKSANVIFADADQDLALDGALAGIFSNNGQQCLAGSRILVEASILDAFVARFRERAAAIRVGDPMDPATEVGPVISREHRDRVLGFADGAKGGEVIVGGHALDIDGGYFMAPTAVLADNDSPVAREEIFGPFATIIPFRDEAHAIALANASRFGLAGYVWTSDVGKALRCSRDIRTGVVWINTPMARELRAPFGGFKDSGIGRESGPDCLAFYTEPKTTTLALDPVAPPAFGKGGS